MSSTPSAGPFQPLGADDPAVVGGYRLAALLGTGGMGKVYLSYTPGGRPLALKVIRPEFSEDPEFRRRFQQEVRAAQRVQGLYTAPVIDSDTEGPQPWLATAYVPGPSLAHAVARHGGLPLRSVLLLTVGVAEALDVIHRAGIVHRDLKPANVLLAADGPRVIDFGIARAADTTALTGTGVSVGTPAFMSPEQAAVGTVTPATDIFALGQIAAYAAIGAPAYGDGPSHAVLYRIVHEDPDLSRLPERLRPLVTRCLSRDPAGRPALGEIIRLCDEISPEPLRQGENWLPEAVTGSITDRLRLPAPVPTPPPQPAAAPTPTAFSPQSPMAPTPTAFSPQSQAQSQPDVAQPYAPAGYTPTGYAVAAAPTQAGPVAPGAPAAPAAPGSVPPSHWSSQATSAAHATPPPGGTAHQPGFPSAAGGPAAPRRKRTALIVAASVIGALVVVGVVGSLLSNGSDPSDKKERAGASSGGSANGGSGDKAKPEERTGEQAVDGVEEKQADPEPAHYKGIDVPLSYEVALTDDPPQLTEKKGSAVIYGKGDFYHYRDALFGDGHLGTAKGKLVLLNSGQQGSLEVCRQETRYTKKVDLDKLATGSQLCLLTTGGHIAVITYRGESAAGDPSRYISVDLSVWRDAEEPQVR
ncbi:serine/threonine-protein kinase [Streptomyces bacillaris]|uniref:serine/threonine-protein kinase n=1 Tax=Streptomyces bacillaris TaxID=68179 RepID=UPI0037FB9E3A